MIRQIRQRLKMFDGTGLIRPSVLLMVISLG